jgi:hypothetical protein
MGAMFSFILFTTIHMIAFVFRISTIPRMLLAYRHIASLKEPECLIAARVASQRAQRRYQPSVPLRASITPLATRLYSAKTFNIEDMIFNDDE